MLAARKAVIKMNNLGITDFLWERKVYNWLMHNNSHSILIEKLAYLRTFCPELEIYLEENEASNMDELINVQVVLR